MSGGPDPTGSSSCCGRACRSRAVAIPSARTPSGGSRPRSPARTESDARLFAHQLCGPDARVHDRGIHLPSVVHDNEAVLYWKWKIRHEQRHTPGAVLVHLIRAWHFIQAGGDARDLTVHGGSGALSERSVAVKAP